METTFWCVVVPALVIVGILVIRARQETALEREVAAARGRYDSALAELRKQPASPDLRQAAVDAGRAYSSLTRQNKAVTVYDEMAVMNDVQAATAAASAASAPTAPVAPTQSVESRLASLKGLLDKGMITQSEYDQRRQKLLDEL